MEQKNREILIRGLTDILIEVFQIDIEEGKNNVYKELSELEDDLLWEKKKILESYVESM